VFSVLMRFKAIYHCKWLFKCSSTHKWRKCNNPIHVWLASRIDQPIFRNWIFKVGSYLWFFNIALNVDWNHFWSWKVLNLNDNSRLNESFLWINIIPIYFVKKLQNKNPLNIVKLLIGHTNCKPLPNTKLNKLTFNY